MEDWTDKHDILRCNPDFQQNHEQRFDCVIVNMVDNPLTCARLLFMFRFTLPSGAIKDVALVRLFKRASWAPKTVWDNCRVVEEGNKSSFVLVEYFIRGVHLVNAMGCNKEDTTFYIDDTVDNDWFLRAGN